MSIAAPDAIAPMAAYSRPLPVLPQVDPKSVEFNAIKYRSVNSGRGQIKHVHDKTRAVIRLAATGMKAAEVAECLGYSQNHVSNILASPIVQDQLVALRMGQDENILKARARLNEAAEQLVQDQLNDISDPNTHVSHRISARQDLLARIGISEIKRTENTNIEHRHSTIDHIKRIAGDTAPNPNITDLEVVLDEQPQASGEAASHSAPAQVQLDEQQQEAASHATPSSAITSARWEIDAAGVAGVAPPAGAVVTTTGADVDRASREAASDKSEPQVLAQQQEDESLLDALDPNDDDPLDDDDDIDLEEII